MSLADPRRFFRDVIKISPVRMVAVILLLHLLDTLTAFTNFAFSYQRFVAYESNQLLRAAWIDGDFVSQVKLEAFVFVLLAMVYIFSRRKSLLLNSAGRSLGLLAAGGLSVAIATNIIGGFLLLPFEEGYSILCLVLGWAIWLASMQFVMGIEITSSLLVASIIPLIGGGWMTLFGFHRGAWVFVVSGVLIWIFFILGTLKKKQSQFW